MRRLFPLTMVLTALLVLAACDEDNSPTGTDGGDMGTATLMGVAMEVYNGTISHAANRFHITGEGIDTTCVVQEDLDYHYILSDIPPGIYTISPVQNENSSTSIHPENRTVTATSGTVYIDPFFRFTTSELTSYQELSLGLIAGRIECEKNIFPDAFTVYLMDSSANTVYDIRETTNGYYCFTMVESRQYLIIPRADFYVFEPSTSTAWLIEDSPTIINYTAAYAGPEPHTITCRVTSDAQEFTPSVKVTLYTPDQQAEAAPDENGRCITPPLIPDTYTLTVSCTGIGTFEHKTMTCDVMDSDVDLGEIMIRYTGQMYYRISGMIADTGGNALPGVSLTLAGYPEHQYGQGNTVTDENGEFFFGGPYFYANSNPLNMNLTAHKDGWIFSPPCVTLAHEYVPRRQLVDFTADFTAVQPLIAPYLPLASGTTWTYAHSVDGVDAGTITVETGTSFTAGGRTWIPLSGYMFAGYRGYLADGARVLAWTGAQAETWAALDTSSWDMGNINGVSSMGERLDPEDVTVPAGTFEACQGIRITVPPNSPSAEVTTYWLADGIGPVRVEFTAFSGGSVIQQVTDELMASEARAGLR